MKDMMQYRVAAAITAILVSASLSSCVTVENPGGPARPTTSVAASPTPTPTAVNTADPATWVVSEAGFGPFMLGATLRKVTAALPDLKPTNAECPNPNATFFRVRGISIAVIVDSSGGIYGVSAGIPFQTPNASTDSGKSPLSGPHTAQGIGYGSTKAELASAYPSLELSALDGIENLSKYTQKTAAGTSISFILDPANQQVGDMSVWTDSPPYEYCG